MNTVQLDQGSAKWLEWRATKRNASESPCIMGASIYAPKTWKHLARIKRGLDVIEETYAMRMGTGAEPKIRRQLEEILDETLEPMVVEDGEYAASLDGMTFSGDTIVEIKRTSTGSDRWNAAKEDFLIEHDRWQVAHQLMVSKARRCIYAVGDGISLPHHVVVTHETGDDMVLRQKWDEFWPLMEVPEEELIELAERTDKDWLDAALAWQEADRRAKEAQSLADGARKRLCTLAGENSATGAGVRVTRYLESGRVSYAKIPELQALDLSQYRGAPAVRYRVAAERGEG